jgi:hypothetical protein
MELIYSLQVTAIEGIRAPVRNHRTAVSDALLFMLTPRSLKSKNIGDPL